MLPLVLVLLSGDGVPDAASRLACAVCTVSVSRVTSVPCIMVAALFLLLVFAVFVDPNACVVGDQGHEFARSAWCFPFRGSPRFVVTDFPWS